VDPRLCVLCRGRGLCGRAYCPILAKASALASLSPRLGSSTEFSGYSPPAIFVGRKGYPKVFAGPGASPSLEKALVGDHPERWASMDLSEVLSVRLSTVFGRRKVLVTNLSSSYVSKLIELALSTKPMDVELLFEKPPRIRVSLSAFEPPMGPQGIARDVRVYGSSSSWRAVERVHSDWDLSASKAIVELYRCGAPVSLIQRLLSVGAIGRKQSRRLVPTRWAITAVDDTLSRWILERVKRFPELSEAQAMYLRTKGNLFVAILLPSKWSFEWMEAWFPGSTWNPSGSTVVIEGDYEGFGGRKDYPSIGGCYFASRLAIAEYLYRIGRQAAVVTLREIYPGFDIPVGVWFVRECVRKLTRVKPVRIGSVRELKEFLDRVTVLGSRVWISRSRILGRLVRSRRLDEYL